MKGCVAIDLWGQVTIHDKCLEVRDKMCQTNNDVTALLDDKALQSNLDFRALPDLRIIRSLVRTTQTNGIASILSMLGFVILALEHEEAP